MRNEYEIRGDVTAVFLKRKDGTRLEMVIDTSDLERADEHPWNWYAIWSKNSKSFYCQGNVNHNGFKTTIMFHRFLTKCPKDMVCDHFNNDTLDNRRINIRVVTDAQNKQNHNGAQSNNTSGVRGVYWNKANGKWVAQMKVNAKQTYLGSFETIEEAECVVRKSRAKNHPFSKEAIKL